MKKNILLFILALNVNAVFSQEKVENQNVPKINQSAMYKGRTTLSIKDFFIPSESNYNKSSYSGGDGTLSVQYYINKGNNSYELTYASFFKNKAMLIKTQTIVLSNTEVKLTKSSSNSAAYSGIKKKSYSKPPILLKLPKEGQNIEWIILGEDGDKDTKCNATLINISFNGEKRQCIKLVSHQLDYSSKIITYYVKGIGLTNTDFLDDKGVKKRFETFEELSYELTDN